MAKGFILYDGASVLDGEPIVVVATLSTSNRKTGNMVQTWILRSDVSPIEAKAQRLDISVCGSCPQRQNLGGSCYVNIGQAPLSIWRAYKRGSYNSVIDYDVMSGRAIRLGAYGDPAAVPFDIWQRLFDAVKPKVWTGYTHQSRHKNFDERIAEYCMISADTPNAAKAAHSKGFRTFRVSTSARHRVANEIECLADSHGVACIDCGKCKGNSADYNIVITVHGSTASRYAAKYSDVNLINTVEVTA